jgi:hypothetical protein
MRDRITVRREAEPEICEQDEPTERKFFFELAISGRKAFRHSQKSHNRQMTEKPQHPTIARQ